MTTAPLAPAPKARTAPSALHVAWARVRLELTAFFRERDSLIFSFLFPIFMLGLFAIVFGDDEGSAVPVAQFFTPGMVASGIALVSFQTLAIGIAIERDEGTLKRLRGTPMSPISYFLGKVGLVLITGMLQLALLVAVAGFAFGVELPSDPSRWVTFLWVYVLGTAAGTVLGIAFSSVPRSGRSASALVVGPLLILQFISGVYFPFNDLPGWLQNVASIFPLKWIAQGMRSVFLPESAAADEMTGAWQHGEIALILGAWTVVGLLLCLRTFRWMRRDDG